MRCFVLVSIVLVMSSAGCTTIESGIEPTETSDSTPTVTTLSPTSTSATTRETTATTTRDTTPDSTSTTPMPTTSPGSATGGKLFAYRVEDPSDNATVIGSTDPRIGNVTLVQEILRRAAEDGDAVRNINGTQLERLERTLEGVPYTSGGESGYYIRYEGTVVRIFIARYQ